MYTYGATLSKWITNNGAKLSTWSERVKRNNRAKLYTWSEIIIQII